MSGGAVAGYYKPIADDARDRLAASLQADNPEAESSAIPAPPPYISPVSGFSTSRIYTGPRGYRCASLADYFSESCDPLALRAAMQAYRLGGLAAGGGHTPKSVDSSYSSQPAGYGSCLERGSPNSKPTGYRSQATSYGLVWDFREIQGALGDTKGPLQKRSTKAPSHPLPHLRFFASIEGFSAQSISSRAHISRLRPNTETLRRNPGMRQGITFETHFQPKLAELFARYGYTYFSHPFLLEPGYNPVTGKRHRYLIPDAIAFSPESGILFVIDFKLRLEPQAYQKLWTAYYPLAHAIFRRWGYVVAPMIIFRYVAATRYEDVAMFDSLGDIVREAGSCRLRATNTLWALATPRYELSGIDFDRTSTPARDIWLSLEQLDKQTSYIAAVR